MWVEWRGRGKGFPCVCLSSKGLEVNPLVGPVSQREVLRVSRRKHSSPRVYGDDLLHPEVLLTRHLPEDLSFGSENNKKGYKNRSVNQKLSHSPYSFNPVTPSENKPLKSGLYSKRLTPINDTRKTD